MVSEFNLMTKVSNASSSDKSISSSSASINHTNSTIMVNTCTNPNTKQPLQDLPKPILETASHGPEVSIKPIVR
jgi:hypothetical protein